jgi:hypothetical protein
MKFYKVNALPEDLNNLTKKDINTIAKLIANTNSAYWDAIGWAESLNRVIKQLDEEAFKKVAKAFKNLKSYDFDSLIDPEMYSSEAQDVSQCFSDLNELLEE